MEVKNPFGNVVYSYTRKQAIDDGVLVDITPLTARFRMCPAVMTTGVHAVVMEGVDPEKNGYKMQWTDRVICIIKAIADEVMAHHEAGDRIDFKALGQDMYALCHGDDDGKACITIMLPHED